ncbi:MAG TPA: methylmalonyl-CoA mutase, partial [Ignavibacteria bacterium]|nr:methylmalonyl-CoA mutase [Ignavibacteria bacterium]
IDKIDSMGGMIQAIENGYVQTEIQQAAYRFEKEVENSERIIIGVNKFQVDEDEQPELLKINLKVQEEQIKFLKQVRSQRNNNEVDKKLISLKNAAQGESNLIPYILDAVKSYASVGEICNALRSIFGEYKETIVL